MLRETFKFSRYGEIIQLPYGNIFPFGERRYLDLVIEGVGTKVLVSQLADKFDTIGIDGVAMAVNDVIRSGATPLAIADNIHTQVSNPSLVKEWMKGIVKGAAEAECFVIGGEIGDVPELITGLTEGKGFDMICAVIGEVTQETIVSGRDVKPGDAIVGFRSSGIHSNGISLARKILFKRWGGKFDPFDVPEGLDKKLVYEVLEPTRIYAKSLRRVVEEITLKAAVHITGDGYLKFEPLTKFSNGIGFVFDNFKPQPIFTLIQKTADDLDKVITNNEMFCTFNMGWGFAVIVEREDMDRTIQILEKSGVRTEKIGVVTDTPGIQIRYNRKKIILK
jgi:phosphoribosylformylglycinamidine cyclo-ligase